MIGEGQLFTQPATKTPAAPKETVFDRLGGKQPERRVRDKSHSIPTTKDVSAINKDISAKSVKQPKKKNKLSEVPHQRGAMRREPSQIASDLYNDYFTRNRRKQERLMDCEVAREKML